MDREFLDFLKQEFDNQDVEFHETTFEIQVITKKVIIFVLQKDKFSVDKMQEKVEAILSNTTGKFSERTIVIPTLNNLKSKIRIYKVRGALI
jgi:hypothetical protein